MNRTRYILLGLLPGAVALAALAHRLPVLLDHRLVGLETNRIDEVTVHNAFGGDARSQYLVGLYFENGAFDRRTNETTAIDWFRKAARTGYEPAQFALSQKLEAKANRLETEPIEIRTPMSPQQVAELETKNSFRPTPEQLEEESLASARRATLVATNRAEASVWLRKAAERGLAEAQYKLGEKLRFEANHARGVKGFPQPVIGAEYWEWWQKAAEQGHGEAAYDLALDFERSEQYADAAKWYKVAADGSSSPLSAASHLAELYHDGRGVPQDGATAIKLALRVADGADPGGDDNLYLRLGTWYAERGPLQNGEEAYKWFNIVAAKGHFFAQLAKQRRDALAAQMTPQQIAEGERMSTEFLERWERRGQSEKPDAQNSILDAESIGSGFFVTEDGYLCTCFHVVEKATRIIVRTIEGSVPAKLVSRDMANDLAILKVDGKFRAIAVAASRTVQLGEPVLTIGFPNIEIQGIEPKLTRGEISSLSGIQDDPRYFQISVPVQPGNSGGPLVDSCGNAVGVVAMRMDDTKALKLTGALPQNVNYAVKGSLLLSLIESEPGLPPKLKPICTEMDRKGRNVVNETQAATALVLVYR